MNNINFEKILPVLLLAISFVILFFFAQVFIAMLIAGIGAYYSFYTKQTVVGVSNISVIILSIVLLVISLMEVVGK